ETGQRGRCRDISIWCTQLRFSVLTATDFGSPLSEVCVKRLLMLAGLLAACSHSRQAQPGQVLTTARPATSAAELAPKCSHDALRNAERELENLSTALRVNGPSPAARDSLQARVESLLRHHCLQSRRHEPLP